jgi:hypothetical protein
MTAPWMDVFATSTVHIDPLLIHTAAPLRAEWAMCILAMSKQCGPYGLPDEIRAHAVFAAALGNDQIDVPEIGQRQTHADGLGILRLPAGPTGDAHSKTIALRTGRALLRHLVRVADVSTAGAGNADHAALVSVQYNAQAVANMAGMAIPVSRWHLSSTPWPWSASTSLAARGTKTSKHAVRFARRYGSANRARDRFARGRAWSIHVFRTESDPRTIVIVYLFTWWAFAGLLCAFVRSSRGMPDRCGALAYYRISVSREKTVFDHRQPVGWVER